MIKTLAAYTYEIDDIPAAVAEVLAQLDLEKNLRKNSVGILTCYAEFIESGVVKELCAGLPFPVIGASTISNAVRGGKGRLMLGLAVLTSDEVSFTAAATEPIKKNNLEAAVSNAWQAMSAGVKDPSMIITFMPMIFDLSGDDILTAMDKACGGIPVFGTMAVDHTIGYKKVQTLFNGEAASDTMAMVLLSGPVNPVFSVNSISDSKMLKQRAVVTASEGNVLQKVNDITVLKYFETLGLAPGGKLEGVSAIALSADFNDGSKPVVRGIFSITPEGYAIAGGIIPVNVTLGVGSLDREQIVHTAEKSMQDALADSRRGGFLIFSCVARLLTLAADDLAEIAIAERCLGGELPYFLSYSGGEICPVYNDEGKPVNRFHNFTIVTCQF